MAKRQTNVVDEVPEGAVDVAPEAEKPAGTEVSIFATAPAWQPHPTLVEIAKLHEEALLLLGSSDLTTEAGYKAVKAYKVAIMRKRTAVDSRRLEEGRQAREYVSQVNSAGNLVMNKLKEIEEPLEAALKAQDDKAINEALAKAKEIEEEQRRKEDERLALIKAEEDRKKAEAQAELDKQRAAIEEQRKLLDAQQAEFNRQQEELRKQQQEAMAESQRLQREAQAVLDAERKRVEDAQQEERRKKEAEEQAKCREEEETRRVAQAEQERLATEARVKKAAEEAAALAVKNEQARVAREAEAAKQKAEREAAAAAKKLAKAPDIEKVRLWALTLDQIVKTAPVCKDQDAIQVVGRVKKELISCLGIMSVYVEAK